MELRSARDCALRGGPSGRTELKACKTTAGASRTVPDLRGIVRASVPRVASFDGVEEAHALSSRGHARRGDGIPCNAASFRLAVLLMTICDRPFDTCRINESRALVGSRSRRMELGERYVPVHRVRDPVGRSCLREDREVAFETLEELRMGHVSPQRRRGRRRAAGRDWLAESAVAPRRVLLLTIK